MPTRAAVMLSALIAILGVCYVAAWGLLAGLVLIALGQGVFQ